jgi:hypothetical protein
MIRTLSLPVVAYDTTLASFASSIDDAVGAACADLEANGSEVLSATPIAMSVSENVGDASKDAWCSERGVIVVITYRGGREG